ncbi:MAG: DinB family protein [Longimicrobiales bacterium]
MIPRMLSTTLALALCTPLAVSGQSVAESLAGLYNVTKTNVVASAEMLDEALYSFRPTDEVRSMGELFSHIANAQYSFCSAAAGEQSPATENFEQTRTSKAQILEALEMGFSYCDGVYANMTDEAGARTVNFFTGPNTAFGVLAFNAAHNYEHYGNLVTYMRLNGITPPSSME